ncbi:hypothetical protein HJG60_008348 [Phyllostomus discolor]|uniref:Uncharacterized protein n=1 Tax=Phyllostomus discolor TaxID=89673 RepID=A0A834DM33_9CHIR|nr:hypothetical protein HJG60_008348 [Phyllostomus discolor]
MGTGSQGQCPPPRDAWRRDPRLPFLRLGLVCSREARGKVRTSRALESLPPRETSSAGPADPPRTPRRFGGSGRPSPMPSTTLQPGDLSTERRGPFVLQRGQRQTPDTGHVVIGRVFLCQLNYRKLLTRIIQD